MDLEKKKIEGGQDAKKAAMDGVLARASQQSASDAATGAAPGGADAATTGRVRTATGGSEVSATRTHMTGVGSLGGLGGLGGGIPGVHIPGGLGFGGDDGEPEEKVDQKKLKAERELKKAEDARRQKEEATAEEKKMDRRKAQQFERDTCFITHLSEEDFVEIFGIEWKTKPDTNSVYLNKEKFKLETLEGDEDFAGLMHPELSRSKIHFLDVSDNALHEIDCLTHINGFENLMVLMAKRNFIASPQLNLPQLLELNLSHNFLTLIPPLDNMKNLETLVLSHNRMAGSFDELGKCRRLKVLNVAYNQYTMSPSQLEAGLDKLAQLHGLSTLRLLGNPFVADFKEYQVFVLKKLRALTHLDGVEITDYLKLEVDETKLLSLECFDDEVEKKKKTRLKDEHGKAGRVHVGVSSVARLKHMIIRLEEVMDDSSALVESVGAVYDSCQMLPGVILDVLGGGMGNTADIEAELEENFWNEVRTRDLSEEQQVARFLELVFSLMERHDSVRHNLSEVLANLTCVGRFRFGSECMRALGRMMKSSTEYKNEGLRVLEQIIIPNLKAFGELSLGSVFTQTLMLGVVDLLRIGDIIEDVAKKVAVVIPLVVKSFKDMTDPADMETLVKLLEGASAIKDNSLLMIELEVDMTVRSRIDNRSIAANPSFRGLWISLVKLAENMIKFGDDAVINKFADDKFKVHVNLISKARDVLKSEPILTDMLACRSLEAILSFVTQMAEKNEKILIEVVESYRLLEVIYDILKAHEVDPQILTVCLHCIIIVLKNKTTCQKNIAKIVEELRKVAPLLQYLGGSKYGILYRGAMKHKMPTDQITPKDEQYLNDLPIPQLASVDEELVNKAWIKIIDLIEWFADDEMGEGDKENQRELVNLNLNESQREIVLLRLLVAPSYDVKNKVMRCIGKIPLDQLESEEIGRIIKRLSDTRNIGAGRSEEMLELVMQQLERLARADFRKGSAGDIFRRLHAEVAIAEAYDILYRNSQRDTAGDEDEEKQKISLSISVVKFFGTCSRHSSLRKYLETDKIKSTMSQVLKWEEEFHSPMAADVAIEQTWIGRALENLGQCLVGQHALIRTKKVVIRVLARIADILEGKSDGLRLETMPGGLSLDQITINEVQMWDATAMKRGIRFMDNLEEKERREESDTFIETDGISKILRFFEGSKVHERQGKYQEQLDAAKRKYQDQQQSAQKRKEAIEAEEEDKKKRDEMEEVQLDLGGGPSTEEETVDFTEMSGRQALLYASQRFEDPIDEPDNGLFVGSPDIQNWSEQLFIFPEAPDHVNEVFGVVAMLRMFHAFLVLPATDKCREETMKELRKPKVMKQLLAVMEGLPHLGANAAAKFLHLMSIVLDNSCFIRSSQDAPLTPDLYGLICNYIQNISEALLPLLKLTKDKRLENREQILCVELAHFMAVTTQAVPYFTYSDHPDAQKEAGTEFLEYMVPRVAVRLSIAMILYDMQIDSGEGFGKAITEEYAQEAYIKKGMKEQATQFLSGYLKHCPQFKYAALEVFNAAQVFQKMRVRSSFMNELLGVLNLGIYMNFVENLLQTWSGDRSERVMLGATVEVWNQLQNVYVVRLLVASTKQVYMLTPSTKTPPYMMDEAMGRWDASWEVHYPRDPDLVWTHQYSECLGLYRFYGMQMLGIDWKDPEPDPKANKMLNFKPPSLFAGYDAVIFQHARDRELLTSCLFANSPPVCVIIDDKGVDAEVKKVVAPAQVLIATVALWYNQVSFSLEPRLFVLTMKGITQFKLDLPKWSPPEEGDIDESFVLEDFQLFNGMAVNTGLESSKKEEGGLGVSLPGGLPDLGAMPSMDMAKVPDFSSMPSASFDPTKVDMSMASMPTGIPMAVPLPKFDIAKKDVTYDFPPKSITFDNAKEQYESITMETGSGNLTIQFYDDTGREHWRRALAFYLAKSGSAWERSGDDKKAS